MPCIASNGQCALCGETFSKRAISRHLTMCRAEHAPTKGKLRKTFRLVVEGRGRPEYWLRLEAPAGGHPQQP